MIKGILGKKLGMTQIFKDEVGRIPVTVIKAGPCVILDVKNKNRDGYQAVQLGFEDKPERLVKKPQLARYKSINVAPKRFVKEFRVESTEEYKVGQEVNVDIFETGNFVDITGISKGKGFQGGMKRWGWKGGPGGHGSMHHRRVGSIGASSYPSRVFKGQHMPGRMGNKQITTQNLEIVEIDKENNLLLIKGSVPGFNKGYVIVKSAKKK